MLRHSCKYAHDPFWHRLFVNESGMASSQISLGRENSLSDSQVNVRVTWNKQPRGKESEAEGIMNE